VTHQRQQAPNTSACLLLLLLLLCRLFLLLFLQPQNLASTAKYIWEAASHGKASLVENLVVEACPTPLCSSLIMASGCLQALLRCIRDQRHGCRAALF
jgi:hypothetical protein